MGNGCSAPQRRRNPPRPRRGEWVLPRMVVESDDEGGVDLETLQRLSLSPAQQPCAPACAGGSEDGCGKGRIDVAAAPEADGAVCCICLSALDDPGSPADGEGARLIRLPCGHRLHWRCGSQWLLKHNSCPECRQPVVEEEDAPAPAPAAPPQDPIIAQMHFLDTRDWRSMHTPP